MGDTTDISWAKHTFNMIIGCNKIGPGCDNCYAADMAHRRSNWDVSVIRNGKEIKLPVWGTGPNTARRVRPESAWAEPLRWNYYASTWRERRRTFCMSLGDVFENHKTVEAQLPRLWETIKATPWLDWLLLTKRSKAIAGKLPADWGKGYFNVWLGVSVEDNDPKRLKRVDDLRKVPATIRFMSYEPALAPIAHKVNLKDIDWLIYGGESGPKHRPDDPQWAEDVRQLCKKTGTTFYYKQGAAFKQGADVYLNGKTYHNFPTHAQRRVPIPKGI